MAWEEVLYTLAGVIIYFVIPPLIVLLVILKKKKRKKAESAKKNEPKSVVNEPQKVVNAKKEENKIEPIVNPILIHLTIRKFCFLCEPLRLLIFVTAHDILHFY